MTDHPPNPVRLPLPRLVDLLVDARDLSQPDVPLLVLHREDVVELPVEVVGDVGRLFPQLRLRVHGDRARTYPKPCWLASPPPSAAPAPPWTCPVTMSTSNSFLHDGQATWTRAEPSSLILR